MANEREAKRQSSKGALSRSQKNRGLARIVCRAASGEDRERHPENEKNRKEEMQ
jgi:hypothetical protein